MTYNFLSLKGYKANHKQMKDFLHFLLPFCRSEEKSKTKWKGLWPKILQAEQINQQILAIILYKDQQPSVKKISRWRGGG